MSVRYMNGFDYYGALSNAQLLAFLQADGMYGSVTQVTPVDGRFGLGKAMRKPAPDGGGSDFYQAFDHVFEDGFIFGTAMRSPSGGFADGTRICMYSGQTGQETMSASVQPLGILEFRIRNSAGVLLNSYRTPVGAYRIGAWFYLQIKWTDALFEVYLNGELQVRVVNPPDPPACDAFRYFSGSITGSLDFDDQYVVDPSDGGVIDYLGNVRVPTQTAIANGDTISLTPVGAISNWQAVINAQNVGTGTVYNTTSVVGEFDLYEANPNVAARDVFALQIKGVFMQDNGVQLFGANQIKTNGNLFPGDAKGMVQGSYASINNYWDENPDTSANFTTLEMNELQFGPILDSSD